MRHAVASRFFYFVLALVFVALPLVADNVTVSGNVTFSSLDGSSLDHDGSANGVFTVSDGDLTVLGTINCNDTSSTNACPMSFAVSGNLNLQPGSAIYAENRTGGGSGGSITFTVGGDVVLSGASGALAGAKVSSGNEDTSASSAGGNITVTAGGDVSLGSGSVVSAGAKGGQAGAISVTAEGSVTVGGTVVSGPSSNIASTRYTGVVLSGGSNSSAGGNITIVSHSHTEPAIVVTSDAVIASQGNSGSAGHVVLEGCGVNVNGLVASISEAGTNAKVTVRSGTSATVDGRDLGATGTRKGMIRADAIQQSAAAYTANILARESVTVHGPAAGTLYAVTSNGGTTSRDASGTVNVVSTEGGINATGNAFAATNADSGDQGGSIKLAAKNNVNLDTARLNASGDQSTSNPDRAGGSISVRSHSGAVSWQNGSGDVRPTGSGAGIPTARQGTITVTYCTTHTFAGSTFPSNGAPVGPFPTTAQSCSPAAPSLPSGEQHPDCNDPPVSANDAYPVLEGGTLNVPAPGVLVNDVDPDGDPITAILVSGPSHASSFTFNADGSFSYTHNGSENHSDSFTYRATDGTAQGNIATVVITVTPVNDPPVANNDSYPVNEGGTINFAAPGVLANDTDPDGPAMTAILVSGPSNASSFVLNPDGSFVYVHNGSETTSDSFTYRANDGTLNSNIATVSIVITAVNDAPVAVNDGPHAVSEGGTLNGPSVLSNDTDAENDSLTAVLVSGPANASSFTLNANGTFTYVHNGSETTSDSFTYRANDGQANSNIATVSITVTPVNDAPVAVNDGPHSVNEGGTLSGPSVLSNDTDAENDTLTAVLVDGPDHAASFALNPNGTFTYVHDGSETTSDSFTYMANDGAANSNVATVTITITPVNDAPVAVNDSGSVSEGGTLNGSSVLSNDTDAENDSLTAVLVSGPANATSFTLNPDGTYTYVHNGGESTSDSFTYKANDGQADSNVATVSITITAVNDAPVANDDGPYNVNEGGTFNGNVVTNDTDADVPANTLTAILVSGPSNASSFTLNPNGTFTYVHNGSETTSDSFTYKVNDGTVDSNVATVTFVIAPVNDAPVAVNDGPHSVNEGGTLSGPSVLANDTDAENDTLTAILVSGPSNAASFTLNPDGTFTYVHNGSETTSDSFTYKANDGTADSNVATVTISIAPVNDAPVAVNDGYSTGFHGTLNVPAPGVLGNDTDADNTLAQLTAVLVSTTTQGTLALNADGSFTYTHTGSSLGSDSFTYEVHDTNGGVSNTATVTISILNTPPTATNDAYSTVGNTELRVGIGPALTPAVVVSGSVLANDTDADNGPSPLVVTTFSATSAAGGTVTMLPNGSFSYLPPTGFTGGDSFTYTVSDGVASANGTVTIAIANRVWYVNSFAAGPQSGRSSDPFATLGQAQAISVANDYIYVSAGAYSTGIVLKNGQRLIGSGVALVVPPHTLAGPTTRPTLGGTVVLASGNLVAGLNVAAASNGIAGTSVAGGTITEVGVSGGTTGIALSNTTGTFTISDVNLSPGGIGLSAVGGSKTINASNLVVVTSGATGIVASSGTLNVSGASSVDTTSGTAVNLSGIALGATFTRVSATSGTNGIVLSSTTGNFTVTGSGATAGSGGTISGMSARGAVLTSASNVTLKNMNFTGNGTVNGDTAAICGNTLAGTNTNCNAGIHIDGSNGVALDNVSVTGGAQIGINGNAVSGLTMTNVTVSGAGNETNEHGVQFVNLNGTVSISGSSFTGNVGRQLSVINSLGTLNASISNTTFNGTGAATGAQGALISGIGTASFTVNVQSSTFSNNFAQGYLSDTAVSASMDVTINNSTFTNNGGGGIVVAGTGSGTLTHAITNNTLTGSGSSALTVSRSQTVNSTGTVTGNIIGTAAVPNSGCSAPGCDGIVLNSTGSGSMAATVSTNQIRQFTGRGIFGNANSGSSMMNLTISNNTIANPGAGAFNGILVQSGAIATDTTSVCSGITGNVISGTFGSTMIRVRNRFPATLYRIPGYAGAGNDTAAVAAYLSGLNGGATASATINGNLFTGGAACPTP
jgi:large repetitive protein